MTLEKFLAKGERADPSTFTLQPNQVLYIRGLNLTPRRLIQSVFEQLVEEQKLLNNPLPSGVRIIASVFPGDEQAGRELLGDGLVAAWDSYDDRAPLQYPVYGLPDNAIAQSDHWAVYPSLDRYLAWARRSRMAEEIIRFLDEQLGTDPNEASAVFHASLLRESEPLEQLPSARAFTDLATLLAERRPFFSSRAVKDAIKRSNSLEELRALVVRRLARLGSRSLDRCRVEPDGGGEPVSGSSWLRPTEPQRAAARRRSVSRSSYLCRLRAKLTRDVGDPGARR